MKASGSMSFALCIACAAAVAGAQEYRLVVLPDVTRATAVGGAGGGLGAYGDMALEPARIDFWRRDAQALYVPSGGDAVVADAWGGLACGYARDGWHGRTEGLIWHHGVPGHQDGSVTTVYRGSGAHAKIHGTNGVLFVGSITYPEATLAHAWLDTSDPRGKININPINEPGWLNSSAEDVTPAGLIVGWGEPVGGPDTAIVWTGVRTAEELPRPAWAVDQTRALGAHDAGVIVGDASGDGQTRPVAWLDGACVELARVAGAALDINADGLAVGWLVDGRGGTVGVAWPDLHAPPLEAGSLVGGGGGVQVTALFAVSDAGHLAGQAWIEGKSVGVVLIRRGAEAGGAR